MLDGLRRLGSGATRGGRKASARNAELLDAIWGALNVARDNKALVVAADGAIVNINRLASQLCGRSGEDLVGKSALPELFEGPPAAHPSATTARWETVLKAASGARIPVEVTYERLGPELQALEIDAMRDPRE